MHLFLQIWVFSFEKKRRFGAKIVFSLFSILFRSQEVLQTGTNILEFTKEWSWHSLQVICLIGICPSISHIHRIFHFFVGNMFNTHWSSDEPLLWHFSLSIFFFFEFIFNAFHLYYNIIFLGLLLLMLAIFILSLVLWNDNDLQFILALFCFLCVTLH